jgi:hypothetical protein
MRFQIALMTVVTLLAGAEPATAQAGCDLPTAAIERLKIEMAETPTLPSAQLIVTIGTASAPNERPQGSQYWIVELWDSAVLRPVPVNALDTVEISKVGWTFTRYSVSKPRTETIGGVPRCAITLAFRGVEHWQVRVVAEPEGRVSPVPVTCLRFCGPDTRTDFSSLRMPKAEGFQMRANFLEGCEAALKLAADQLQRAADGVLRLSEWDLLKLIPTSCMNENYKLKVVRRRIPDGGLSFRYLLAQ